MKSTKKYLNLFEQIICHDLHDEAKNSGGQKNKNSLSVKR